MGHEHDLTRLLGIAGDMNYIIVHELVHFMEANHTPGFWHLVERTMPDFEQRQEWLRRHGGRLVGL